MVRPERSGRLEAAQPPDTTGHAGCAAGILPLVPRLLLHLQLGGLLGLSGLLTGCLSLYLGDDPVPASPTPISETTLEPTEEPSLVSSPTPTPTPLPSPSPALEPSPSPEPSPPPIDLDGDGSPAELDCNDLDAAVYPGAVESCANATDDDCDGHNNEGCDVACDIYELTARLVLTDAQGRETSNFKAGEPVYVEASLTNGCASEVALSSDTTCFVELSIFDDHDDLVISEPLLCADTTTTWNLEPADALALAWIWYQVDASGKTVKADDAYEVVAEFSTGVRLEDVVMISACGNSDEISCDNAH